MLGIAIGIAVLIVAILLSPIWIWRETPPPAVDGLGEGHDAFPNTRLKIVSTCLKW